MSGKDESIFSKEALMGTQAGKEIIKQGLFKSKGFRQFNQYKEKTEQEFGPFAKRFTSSLHAAIQSDSSPALTMEKFASEVGSQELVPDAGALQDIKARLSSTDVLQDRVARILNSNFVKMTFPVFNALYDGAAEYFGDKPQQQQDQEKREAVIDGHIIAIDLSEPMDRIVDRDEDLDYLEDYKFMCPYILDIARLKIAQGGDSVLKAFEEGFRDARVGQYIDVKLKMRPSSINDENMGDCYKKYRAVMGTAGRNMALNRRPLADIFHLGMAKAGEGVGCGNEIEDAIKNGAIKIPSWPLYYSLNTGDARRGFELTMQKSELYLKEAELALEMLPEKFTLRPFLEFLFLTVRHYNQYWYNELNRRAPFADYYSKMEAAVNRQ
ncbi:hypothetical protein [Nitrososphaera sp.]|uniref:hypothetical protein n=1 Tax=Nitrososphaera sp. TaxID=1971748 RepID=UPI00307EF1A2